jgi:hypothetical protein
LSGASEKKQNNKLYNIKHLENSPEDAAKYQNAIFYKER